ncbi:hypothetical protein V8F33_006369 [Rhypophila sp. PSN 637]
MVLFSCHLWMFLPSGSLGKISVPRPKRELGSEKGQPTQNRVLVLSNQQWDLDDALRKNHQSPPSLYCLFGR